MRLAFHSVQGQQIIPNVMVLDRLGKSEMGYSK